MGDRVARAADQVRASDVTLWGIVALACWAFAVLSANVSGLVPAGALGALHASRLEGATVNQLRAQVAALELDAQRLRRENNLLLQRFSMAEQASGEVARRVGALEVSIPQLSDAAAAAQGPRIDQTLTGAIGAGAVLSFDAEGGSVSVQHKPMDAVQPGLRPAANAAPETVARADPNAFGLALAFPVESEDAEAQWQSLTARVGTLLIGLAPLLAPVEGSSGQQIVAGPLASRSEAEELCARMDRVGIPCEPAPYTGNSLPLLN